MVLNLSDHVTRSRFRQKSSEVRAIGVVLGRQSGRLLEVVNTIEVNYTTLGVKEAAGEIEIDQVFAK